MDSPKKILVVDDVPEFLEIFSTELKSAGYEVLTADNGAKAIELAKSSRPDLILMDVQMPGMTGVETTLKIKENVYTKDAKIVFLTNLGNSDADSKLINELAAQDIHADGYIKKTEDMKSLLEDVKRYIDS